MAETMSLEHHGKLGLDSPMSDYMLDKLCIPHGMTARQMKRMQKEAYRSQLEYARRRQDTIDEFHALVASGKICQPGKYVS